MSCSGLLLVAVTLLGLGLGLIVWHTTGTIPALVTLTAVIPSVLTGLPAPWSYEIGRYMFFDAATQLVKLHPDPHLFGPMGSTLVVLGYAAAALLTAAHGE